MEISKHYKFQESFCLPIACCYLFTRHPRVLSLWLEVIGTFSLQADTMRTSLAVFTDVTTQSEQSIPQNGWLASPPAAPISEAVVLWERRFSPVVTRTHFLMQCVTHPQKHKQKLGQSARAPRGLMRAVFLGEQPLY